MTYHPAFTKTSYTESDVIEYNVSGAVLGEAENNQLIEAIRKRGMARYRIPTVHLYTTQLNLSPEYFGSQRIFEAIQAFYQSHNNPRDRQIAERLTTLYRDTLTENESILADSVAQFAAFFLKHRDLRLPRITLTPDGTLRVRWIQGAGNFTAIEFTGEPVAKLVAEIPRESGLTARHFSSEPVNNILSIARAIGASFA